MAGVGVGAAVAIAGIPASRPYETLALAVAHTSFVLAAPLLGALAPALVGGVALSLRR